MSNIIQKENFQIHTYHVLQSWSFVPSKLSPPFQHSFYLHSFPTEFQSSPIFPVFIIKFPCLFCTVVITFYHTSASFYVLNKCPNHLKLPCSSISTFVPFMSLIYPLIILYLSCQSSSHIHLAQSAEYGIFGQDIWCVKANFPVCQCAQAVTLVCWCSPTSMI